MPGKLICSARGSGGVEDGFQRLDDGVVQFMLIKFPVGSGTFKRNKFVYVHHIGPHCPAVKRGKWNAELDNVLKRFQVSAGLAHSDGKAGLSFDLLVNKLQKVFVADNGTFDLAALRDEYNKRLEEEKAKMEKDADDNDEVDNGSMAPGSPGSPLRVRKMATDLGATLPMVLKAIAEEMGPFNWVTVLPPKAPGGEPQLVQAGSNGLFELMDTLEEDKILFGVVRVGFGTGRFRRTKRIAFQWNGDAVGAVAKGKANALRDSFSLMPTNAIVTFNGSEDATVESFLRNVEKWFVVDHINMQSTKDAPKAVSAEEYVKALEEEQKANSAFYNEPEEYQSPPASPTRNRTYDVEETIKLIRADEGGLTWGIFQIEA
eukprot:CAMPEP_0174856668 /NCGR_PEP_ID=MMETSP1114-20130205/36156_1 /TAXON_ID=312471 /ORGANISM="Neobodo designis, Strain CCAP 1951/1" /LENGTH=373 /DNA_ID=CAMNT_0016091473 /DNA_START=49 /DNA_END=1170 /DNA_ORIENTATION=-